MRPVIRRMAGAVLAGAAALLGYPAAAADRSAEITSSQLLQYAQGAQSPDSETLVPLGTVKALVLKGDLRGARAQLDSAATIASSTEAQARLLLGGANLLSQASEQAGHDPLSFKASEQYYHAAQQLATGTLRLQVYNSYAMALLRNKRAQDALKVMSEIKSDFANSSDAPAKARFDYNFGRTLETVGDIPGAIGMYRESAELDQSFRPAARAAVRMLVDARAGPNAGEQAADFIELLIGRGDLDIADDSLRRILSAPHATQNGGAERLVLALVNYFATARPSLETMRSAWSENLQAFRRRAPEPAQSAVGSIIAAYTDEFSVSFEHGAGRSMLPGLTALAGAHDRIHDLSLFLEAAGNAVQQGGDPRKALQRYAAAWTLDTANSSAALAAANLLLDRSADLDPDGQVLEQFIFFLFGEKGDAYLGQDWPSILRFHTILGTIFERQDKLGPREDPRSAAFQWEHALIAQQNLIQSGSPDVAAVPYLRERLARVYEKLNDTERARAAYIAAAEDALALQLTDLTKATLTAATGLGNLSPQEMAKVSALRSQLG